MVGAPPGAGISYGRIYARLVAHGHDLDRIRGYTERQLKLFGREALRIERERSAATLMDVNAAFAGGHAARDRLRDLKKDD